MENNSPWKDITLTSDSKLCDENLQYLVSTAKSYELTAPKGTEGAKGEGGKGAGIQLTGGSGMKLRRLSGVRSTYKNHCSVKLLTTKSWDCPVVAM